MRLNILSALCAVLLTTACVAPPAPPAAQDPQTRLSDAEIKRRADRAARQFVRVVETVEPVAEAECRKRTRDVPCDFIIVVDDRPGQPPNAFHTLGKNGEPLIAFNLALILSVQNADELAFVMGHEAAHHIAGHIERAKVSASVTAQVFAGAASVISGGDPGAIRAGGELGAAVGLRSFSKEFELEADALGTVITKRAGFDPVRGAEFFNRLPDPGNRFLGSHPPNAARIATVRRVAAGL